MSTLPELSKDITLYKVDEKGIATPVNVELEVYDPQLDHELLHESALLMQHIVKQKAIDNTMAEFNKKHDDQITQLNQKIDKETDDKKKNVLINEKNVRETTFDGETVKTKINHHVINNSINDSRNILKELNKEKEKQTTKYQVELIPCNTSESFYCFEEHKTVEGKDTNDWLADLISKKSSKPSYSLEDAKLLLPEFKDALRRAFTIISGYKVKGYRDLISQRMIEQNRPLTVKKD